jgi:hypothetical protein
VLDWSVQAVVERRPRDLQRKLSKVAYDREQQARVRALHNAALMLETKAEAKKRFKADMLSFTYLYGLALHCSGKGQLTIAHPGFMLDWYGRPRRGNISNYHNTIPTNRPAARSRPQPSEPQCNCVWAWLRPSW